MPKDSIEGARAGGVLGPPEAGSLPAIPGGWMRERVEIGETRFELTLPADPDAFLDDPQVQAANRRDDSMPYWPYLWPAARMTAGAFLRSRWSGDERGLEIGCGIGLASLAALARGIHMTMTDCDPLAVETAAHNARSEGFSRFEAVTLDWRSPPPIPPFSLILACDVLYEDRTHGPILDLLETTLAPGGRCWIGEPGRSRWPAFAERAEQRGFTVQHLDETGRACAPRPVGRFRVLVLSRTGPIGR